MLRKVRSTRQEETRAGIEELLEYRLYEHCWNIVGNRAEELRTWATHNQARNNAQARLLVNQMLDNHHIATEQPAASRAGTLF